MKVRGWDRFLQVSSHISTASTKSPAVHANTWLDVLKITGSFSLTSLWINGLKHVNEGFSAHQTWLLQFSDYPNYGIFKVVKTSQLDSTDSTRGCFRSTTMLRKYTFPLFYSHSARCLIPQSAIMSDLLHGGLLPNLLFSHAKKVITPVPPEPRRRFD